MVKVKLEVEKFDAYSIMILHQGIIIESNHMLK